MTPMNSLKTDSYNSFEYSTNLEDYPQKSNQEKSGSSWLAKTALVASLIIGGAGIYYYRSQALQKNDEISLGKVNKFLRKDDCESALQYSKTLYFSENKDLALNSIFRKCPDYQEQAASLMSSSQNRDQAFRELFIKALKRNNCNHAFDMAKQIYYADKDLSILGEKCPHLREDAVDQMSFIERSRQYPQLVNKYLTNKEDERALKVAERVFFNDHLLKTIAFQGTNLSVSEKAAKLLPKEDRDGPYQRIVQAYIDQGDCSKALNLGKELNYGYLGEEFGAAIRPKSQQKYYRGASDQRLYQAIEARRSRLDLVAYQCDSKISREAKQEKSFNADDFIYLVQRFSHS